MVRERTATCDRESMTTIRFPSYLGTVANMMPFVFGDRDTLPGPYASYAEIVELCAMTRGSTCYLTVHESWVPRGQTQRRGGVHTDGTSDGPWGGGWGSDSIYLASTDGDTLIWDTTLPASMVDCHGAPLVRLGEPSGSLSAGVLHRFTDRTPHAARPAATDHHRQFVRVVGPDIHGWYARHSTPNPVGVLPRAPIITADKFTA